MAESTLALTYTQLQFAVAHYLGLREVASWTAVDIAMIDRVIASGLRQFYFPPSVNGQEPYQWSFLTPITTLVTIAPYSTGTIAITEDGTTVTLADGTWPSWAATHGSLVVDTSEYTIASRTDGEFIELDDAWSEDTITAEDFTLKHDGNYDLPDDFGGIEGKMVVESESYKPDIIRVGEGKIRSLRQTQPQNSQTTSSTTSPYYAAVRPKAHETTTAGQRFEIMFFPLPATVLTISYVKRILPQMLVTTTIEYPYGGTEHAETIRAACIAAAEEQENDNQLDGRFTDTKEKMFQKRLTASIALDKQMNGIDFYGYNSDDSDTLHRDEYNSRNRRRSLGTSLVTYDT